MVKLTEEMQRLVRRQKLGFVATVSPDGTPNLSPKWTTTVWDDEHPIFADIASPNTIRNLLSNLSVEVNVIDPFVRKAIGSRKRPKCTGREIRASKDT
jgi:predicted pyridoxine 5'-phosphate oxidase superfamily flavin-nucleotide-binding protein